MVMKICNLIPASRLKYPGITLASNTAPAPDNFRPCCMHSNKWANLHAKYVIILLLLSSAGAHYTFYALSSCYADYSMQFSLLLGDYNVHSDDTFSASQKPIIPVALRESAITREL